ncbi:R3H domain-containing protein 4-like [Palaemon carinicauda]|uniref:R3H domain-containing protein 4-like n=1 Tax=Palaemon carinicauda TaxID=392227 RepID=UPI0035B5A84B
MGVIRKLRNKTAVVSFSRESLNSLGISQPSTQPPTPPVETVASSTNTQRDGTAAAPRGRMPSLLIERLENHRPRAGARKTRRANNTRALQTLIEDEFEETGEPSIVDFQPKTENAFSQLLNNCDNMRVWQYFISCSEAEQMAYLEAISPKQKTNGGDPRHGVSFTQVKSVPKEEQQADELPEVDGFVMVPVLNDCREVHPAYTPEQHFNFINPQLRSAFKKKHLSLGILSYLEEEVIGAFTGDPSAVYISPELSSYERLLLHGLCQYNRLKSKSMTIARTRRTKVSNKHNCFHKPKLSLTKYLENCKK